MKKIVSLILVALVLLVSLAGCGLSKEFGAQASNDGFMPEAFLPADVGMIFSYSLRDPGQFDAMQAISAKLGEDGDIAQAFSEGFQSQFEGSDVSYEEDFMPAFGDKYRVIFGSRLKDGEDSAESFSITTLEDPAKMQATLDKLVDEGQLQSKNLSSVDAYVDEGGEFYAAIYEDLFLAANAPENLVDMLNLDEGDSLWADDDYQDALESVGADYLLYALVFPGKFEGQVPLLSGLGLNAESATSKNQGLVVRAEAEGFDFDIFTNVDKDLSEEAGITMDSIPRAEAYLYAEVPAEGLMAYIESYGLQQSVAYKKSLGAQSATLDSASEFVRSYFGMDLEQDFLSFWDQGYAIALHQNEAGGFPGISIYVDMSSNEEAAGQFMEKLDQQVSGLMFAFDAALPGAVTKSELDIQGASFDVLKINLSSLETATTLPSILTAGEIQLAYGLLDGRFLITTAKVWEQGGNSIKDGELYAGLKGYLDDMDEGLILLDAQSTAAFIASLTELRDGLDLGVSDASLTLENFLKGFLGAIAAGKTETYAGGFGGFLMLAE